VPIGYGTINFGNGADSIVIEMPKLTLTINPAVNDHFPKTYGKIQQIANQIIFEQGAVL